MRSCSTYLSVSSAFVALMLLHLLHLCCDTKINGVQKVWQYMPNPKTWGRPEGGGRYSLLALLGQDAVRA